MCEVQASLFELSGKEGLDSAEFTRAFMTSEVAAGLDERYHQYQWAGEEYMLGLVKKHMKMDSKKTPDVYDRDTLFWMGYVYRYWHYYKNVSSKKIVKTAPPHIMKQTYLGFHTLDSSMAVDDLIEISKQKQQA